MQRSSPFLFLVVLAAWPLVTTVATVDVDVHVDCFSGVYKANSTYEANLRRLAAVLPAETASSQGLQALRSVGYWPNRVRASSNCYWGVSSSSCAACVAAAFPEAERACPYGKKVFVFAQNCTLNLVDFPRSLYLGGNIWFDELAPAVILQAIGFGWLFFMLLQEWRDKKRSSMMHCTSLPSRDN